MDYGEANVMDEQTDVVSLMTIHKSKGLEFPVVFVAGTGKQFNMQDTKKSLVLHSELGVGADSIDAVARTKTPTLLKKMIQRQEAREATAEEIRVLYVAMTRAKEKLILTGAVEDAEKELQSGLLLQNQEDERLSGYSLTKAKKYLDWILPAVYRRQGKEEAPIQVHKVTMEELITVEACEQAADVLTKEVLQQWDTTKVYDAEMKQQIQEQLSYVYPFSDTQMVKQKVSVSEVKKRTYLEEEGEEMFREEEVIPLLPKFLQKKEEVTGARRGTVYHKVLELLDITKEYDDALLQNEIRSMVEKGWLSEEMVACIRQSELLRFLHSPIGIRLQQAGRKGLYHAEQPFVVGVPASQIYPGSMAKDDILVQGIMDVYFEEDGQLVVLDYKTDKVSQDSQLIERYHTQLAYYAEALERLTGKKVKEKLIYSFWLQKTIILE